MDFNCLGNKMRGRPFSTIIIILQARAFLTNNTTQLLLVTSLAKTLSLASSLEPSCTQL